MNFKKIFTGFVSVTMFASTVIFMPTEVFADDTVEILDTGKCGDDIQWTMYSDYTLELSGTGATYDYTFGNQVEQSEQHDEYGFPGWYEEYQDSIKKIVVDEGITRIGDLTFCGSYGELETIDIPDSIEEIGYFALATVGYLGDNNAHTINKFPENLRIIEDGGFYGITFNERIVLPETVDKIGSLAFNSELKEYTIPGNVSEISEYAFGFVDNDSLDDDDKSDRIFESVIEQKQCSEVLDMFTADTGVSVYGYKSTAAETYANENGFTFIALDDEPEPVATSTTDTEENTEDYIVEPADSWASVPDTISVGESVEVSINSVWSTLQYWTSSDDSVLQVSSNGGKTATITALAPGTVTLSANYVYHVIQVVDVTTTTTLTSQKSTTTTTTTSDDVDSDETTVTTTTSPWAAAARDENGHYVIDEKGRILDINGNVLIINGTSAVMSQSVTTSTTTTTTTTTTDTETLPQTGYSGGYKLLIFISAFMSITGIAIVVKSIKENE
jgi:hypothetical protein